MRVLTLFGTTLALTASIVGVAVPSIQAIQLADGTVAFEKPPRLVDAQTTYNGTSMTGARYYFTLSLPENAGEPLGRITISQRQGFEKIDFELEDTRAFEGQPRRKGEKLAIANVTEDDKTKTISVMFDPPIAPGKTLTVELRPYRNPWTGGAYIFGVTAFPAGEKAYGLYLGVGRLQFYEPDGDFSIFR